MTGAGFEPRGKGRIDVSGADAKAGAAAPMRSPPSTALRETLRVMGRSKPRQCRSGKDSGDQEFVLTGTCRKDTALGMVRAALLMICGMSLIPLGDTAGKMLTSSGVSPFFVAWTRFALGALLLLPFLRREHFDIAKLIDPRLIFRGLLIVGGIVSILTALRTEPIANVFGAFFIGPVVSYALSVRLLGERVTPARTALLVLGFVGVLLIARPGFGMGPGIGYALLAGCFYGSYLTASRWLAGVASPRTLLLSQLLVGAVLLAPFGALHAPPLTANVSLLLTVSASASMAGNLLLTVAYKIAPATRLAPLVYVQLIAATLFGIVFFDTFPDALALAGLTLLLVSGFGSVLLRR